jgi:hypothetical protein
VKSADSMLKCPPSVLLLTLEILCLKDSVGDAIGSGQKILASPVEGAGAGTAIKVSGVVFMTFMGSMFEHELTYTQRRFNRQLYWWT